MLQNITGQEVDYDLFKKEFDSNPEIKNLVQSFNGQGVIIKTKEKEKPTQLGKKPNPNNAAALRAADKVLQRPG